MKTRKYRLWMPLVLGIGLLQACGGGGGGGSTSGQVGDADLATQDATGVWEGTITEDGVGTYTLVGLLTGNQLRFISIDGTRLYQGSFVVSSGGEFAASTTNFIIGNAGSTTSVISGNVRTASTLSATYTSSNGATGDLNLTFDPITTRGASLATTDDNWTVTTGGTTTTFSIDATGAITGSDTDGCVYNGTVSIIDASVNIYGMTIVSSFCGVYSGTYTGYAVVADTTVANDTLIYTVSNSNYVSVGMLERI